MCSNLESCHWPLFKRSQKLCTALFSVIQNHAQNKSYWKQSKRTLYLFFLQILSSSRLNHVWMMFEWCLNIYEDIWLICVWCPHDICTIFGLCLFVIVRFKSCLKHVCQMMFGSCLDHVWIMSGSCLHLSASCLIRCLVHVYHRKQRMEPSCIRVVLSKIEAILHVMICASALHVTVCARNMQLAQFRLIFDPAGLCLHGAAWHVEPTSISHPSSRTFKHQSLHTSSYLPKIWVQKQVHHL